MRKAPSFLPDLHPSSESLQLGSGSRMQLLARRALSPARLLPGENRRAFEKLKEYLWAEFEPVGSEEERELEKMLWSCWRLRRLAKLEEEYARAMSPGRAGRVPAALGALLWLNDAAEGHTLPRLLEYRRSLEASYRRSWTRLQRLQRLRQAAPRSARSRR